MSVGELTIETIAAGGDGVGRIEQDGGNVVVFVPRTAPGDRIRATLDVRRRFARGSLDELLDASSKRVDPLCYHYRVDKCGGCQLQHMSYEAQLEAKRQIVHDALTRIGKRRIDDVPPVVASDKQWRYRRKLTLAMRRRTHGGTREWVIGLHPYDDPVGVFQLADCPITDERVLAVWREIMDASSFFPPVDELRASVQLYVGGSSERPEGTIGVVMEGGHTWPTRAAFFEAVRSVDALWWRPTHRAKSLVAERSSRTASASFEQVNEGVGRALHDYVLERTRSYRPEVVVDAYAGTGATAIPLATDGVKVIAIEADRDASAQCGARLPSGSRALAARVEDVIADTLPADVVLLNPPRTGLHERVSSILATTPALPRAIVYVSCDPATLARDLSRLSKYRIVSVRAFDMFPQTAHVETVCELTPEAHAA